MFKAWQTRKLQNQLNLPGHGMSSKTALGAVAMISRGSQDLQTDISGTCFVLTTSNG